ncbi:hypothetical protein F66182_8103 [Fusarium sp. NRRL 66182]|nr:hypothetical protein F66182_8103 [Fusarium sp. NRRL 66182]
MSGWTWSPRQAMLQMSQHSMAMAPRPTEGLPSMPALNLPHPPIINSAQPVYNNPAPPGYRNPAPPVYNNPAPPNYNNPAPPTNSNPVPPAYNPPPPVVPHSFVRPVPVADIPPSVTGGMTGAMPRGGSPIPRPTPAKNKAKTTTTTTTASRKRKSDVAADNTQEDLFPTNVVDIPSDDERLEHLGSETCNSIRRKIRNWTESGAQKVGEFQRTIGVSSKSYGSFMNRTGTWDGVNTDTFIKAHHFFKKRELQGLPLKANKPKKPKTAASSKALDEALDVSDVDQLPGEADGTVPIYDTCEDIRKKIRPLLAKEGMTQAAFLRALNKNLPEGKSVSQANLRYFMGRKGAREGNTNITFYAAYVFFEKKRIKAGKPKTQFRQEMEKAWGPEGFDIEHGSNQHYTCFAGEEPIQNKYGKINVVRTGRGLR